MQKHKNKMKKRKAIRACTRKEINYFVSCKRSLSPVIATVLLVAMVIVIGAIVFLWMRGSVKEVIYKFGEENIELACGDVSFDVEYYTNISGDTLYVVNNGNVPIADFKVQVITGGTKTTFNLVDKYLVEDSSKKFIGITSGNGKEVSLTAEDNVKNAEEILVIPILQGRTSEGILKTYVCDEIYGERRDITV